MEKIGHVYVKADLTYIQNLIRGFKAGVKVSKDEKTINAVNTITDKILNELENSEKIESEED